jgi:signal transduction histidine kinase
MIQNLLDASRLRAGQSLKIEFEECDFLMLVQEVVEDLSFAYGERFIVVLVLISGLIAAVKKYGG